LFQKVEYVRAERISACHFKFTDTVDNHELHFAYCDSVCRVGLETGGKVELVAVVPKFVRHRSCGISATRCDPDFFDNEGFFFNAHGFLVLCERGCCREDEQEYQEVSH
jgi:hypothetical protein